MFIRGRKVFGSQGSANPPATVFYWLLFFALFVTSVGKESFDTGIIQSPGLGMAVFIVVFWKMIRTTEFRMMSMISTVLWMSVITGLLVSCGETGFPKETYTKRYRVIDKVKAGGRHVTNDYVVVSNGKERALHIIHPNQTYEIDKFYTFKEGVSCFGTTFIAGCVD